MLDSMNASEASGRDWNMAHAVTYKTTGGAAPKPQPFKWSNPSTVPPKRTSFAANTNRPPPLKSGKAGRPITPKLLGYLAVGAAVAYVAKEWAEKASGEYTVPGARIASNNATPQDWFKDDPPPGNELSAAAAAWETTIPNPWNISEEYIHYYGEWVPGGANGVPWTIPPRGNWKYERTFQDGRPDLYYDPYPLQPGVLDIPEEGPIPGTVTPTPKPTPYFQPGEWEFPYPRPAPEPVAEPVVNPQPKPGVVPSIVVEVHPDGFVSPVKATNPRKTPEDKKETKFGVHGVAGNIMVRIAIELGNGMEWIEVFSDGWGYSEAGRRWDTIRDRVKFLERDDLVWDWTLFMNSLAKKVAEDIVAGAFFGAITNALNKVGVNVPYKLTGLTS